MTGQNHNYNSIEQMNEELADEASFLNKKSTY